MGSSVVNDLWLARREGAALFGWGTSFTGPQATRVDVTSTHDRHHFVGWPAGWVVKKASGCGNSYGRLWLEVKTTYKWVDFLQNVVSGLAYWDSGTPNYQIQMIFGAGGTPTVYDPVEFSNGDGHVYETFDWYNNDTSNSDPAFWLHWFGIGASGGGADGPYSGFEDGGFEAHSNNDPAGYQFFAGNWTNKMTPSDLFAWADGLSLVTTVDTTTACYEHNPASSHWNRSASVTVSNYGSSSSPYNWDGVDYLGDVIGTFLMDEDWTATGRLENLTCKFRWRYDPQSSVGCKWWAGKVVSAKVLYKKAAVTKTDGPDGVFYSLGTWVSGGDSTQSLTLQDSYSAAYVASEVTMPTEEGYVYVIDDIEVLSVT